jgi:mono/diheme cytochrome c family protein
MRSISMFAVALPMMMALPSARAQPTVTYAELAPIVAERCALCHAGDAAAAGLRLDSLEAVLKGSSRGPVVRAGDPAGSELIRRLKGTSLPRMPMTGPPFLSDAQIAQFERWIAGGLAAGSVAAPAARPPARPAPGEPVTYAHVAPIFATRCARCHAEKGQMGPAPEGYVLTSYAATLSAADRVRVVPGQPAASELLRRIRGQARPRMPFDGPPYLSAEDTRLIEDWIAQGARSAEGHAAPLPVGAAVRLNGTLTDRWQLDDLPLRIGPGVRFDKTPATGDAVELRGRIGADGSLAVERLRRR